MRRPGAGPHAILRHGLLRDAVRSCGVPGRRTGAVVLAAVALSACGGGDKAVTAPGAVPTLTSSSSSAPSAPPSPALPPDVAAPTTTTAAVPAGKPRPTGERGVAQLTAQLAFTAPAQTDPGLAAAVAAYRDFLTQFVVAQGLPDANWAPLVARLDPALVQVGLQPLRESVAANQVTLGTFTEKVQKVAGSGQSMFLTSCADASDRDIFDRTTGALVGPVNPAKVPLKVTMQRSGEQWLLAGYNQADGDVTCP